MSSILTLLSVILTAAVDNRMLAINPCQNLRLGSRDDRTEHAAARRRQVITDIDALRIARQIGVFAGHRMEVKVLTAMFTGMRW
jgi:hypothetical protein